MSNASVNRLPNFLLGVCVALFTTGLWLMFRESVSSTCDAAPDFNLELFFLVSSSFAGAFFILINQKRNPILKSNACIYFALAMLAWAFRGLIFYLVPPNLNQNCNGIVFLNNIKPVFSTLNNGFFIYGLMKMLEEIRGELKTLYQNIILAHPNGRKIILIVTISVVFLTLFISVFSPEHSEKIQPSYIPDFIYSTITILYILFAMWSAFKMLEMSTFYLAFTFGSLVPSFFVQVFSLTNQLKPNTVFSYFYLGSLELLLFLLLFAKFHRKTEDLADQKALLADEKALLFEQQAKLAEENAQLFEQQAKLAQENAILSKNEAKLAQENALLSEKQAKLALENARLFEKRAEFAQKQREDMNHAIRNGLQDLRYSIDGKDIGKVEIVERIFILETLHDLLHNSLDGSLSYAEYLEDVMKNFAASRGLGEQFQLEMKLSDHWKTRKPVILRGIARILVELNTNAYQAAIRIHKTNESVCLTNRIYADNDAALVLEIEDNGPGFDFETQQLGTGLTLIMQFLTNEYADSFIEFKRQEHGGMKVRVVIPKFKLSIQ